MPKPRVDIDSEIEWLMDVILGNFKLVALNHSECVGRSFAYQEMRMVVCLLMQTICTQAKGYEPHLWERNNLDMEDRFAAHEGTL